MAAILVLWLQPCMAYCSTCMQKVLYCMIVQMYYVDIMFLLSTNVCLCLTFITRARVARLEFC